MRTAELLDLFAAGILYVMMMNEIYLGLLKMPAVFGAVGLAMVRCGYV